MTHKGAALVGLGRYEEAEVALTAARAAARASDDADKQVLAAYHLTLALLERGGAQLPAARQCATDALALAQARSVGDGRVAAALEALAAVCLEAGEAAEAAECCARAMLQGTDGRLRVGDGGGLLLRARAFAQRGDWATADSQLNAALEVRLSD